MTCTVRTRARSCKFPFTWLAGCWRQRAGLPRTAKVALCVRVARPHPGHTTPVACSGARRRRSPRLRRDKGRGLRCRRVRVPGLGRKSRNGAGLAGTEPPANSQGLGGGRERSALHPTRPGGVRRPGLGSPPCGARLPGRPWGAGGTARSPASRRAGVHHLKDPAGREPPVGCPHARLSVRLSVPQEELPEPFEHLLQRIARRPKPQQFFGLMGKRDAGELGSHPSVCLSGQPAGSARSRSGPQSLLLSEQRRLTRRGCKAPGRDSSHHLAITRTCPRREGDILFS